MAKQYAIKWRSQDYMKLGRAVAQFNRKIRKIQTEENKMYLPAFERYEWQRDNIKTRQEFNRVINMLKSFSKEGAEELIETPSGEKITKWENRLARRGIKRGIETLTEELKYYDEQRTIKPYQSQKERQKRAELKNLKKFDSLKGYDFSRLKRRGLRWNELDRDYKKAELYRQNYYIAMKELKNFKNYNILKEKLDSIKNPKDFYEYIQQSEILSDLFAWYDDNAGSYVMAGFASNEDGFDYALQVELGFKLEITNNEFDNSINDYI